MTAPFMIDQVSWHTNTSGNTETREQIIRRFFVIASFLQENGLTARNIACPEGEIDDNFGISSADLSDQGMIIMRAAYDKWLQKIDNGMPPEDLSVFLRALKQVRSSGE